MFVYEKKLQYPIRIANPNPQLAAVIISLIWWPRWGNWARPCHSSQRYSHAVSRTQGSVDRHRHRGIRPSGNGRHDRASADADAHAGTDRVGRLCELFCRPHRRRLPAGRLRHALEAPRPWPSPATPSPTSRRDLAAEQKARVTYDNILRISDDPDVNDAIRFLREREIVHFQRFGEAVELLRQRLDEKNVYYMNPAGPTNNSPVVRSGAFLRGFCVRFPCIPGL